MIAEKRAAAFGFSPKILEQLLGELKTRLSGESAELSVLSNLLEDAQRNGRRLSFSESWPLLRIAYLEGFVDLLNRPGLRPVSYNIEAPFNFESRPLGFNDEFPQFELRQDKTTIAGLPVDFPIGLPASVLAANARWIKFYARRGFGILTYKTVRTTHQREHPYPNWVFLKNPEQLHPPINGAFVGQPGYWPEDAGHLSMANSFGVPSNGPDWWQKDVAMAKSAIREGHQILIVSVIGSKEDSLEELADDYAAAAILARKAGADVIEANLSCPNVTGHPTGAIYTYPGVSGVIAKRIRTAMERRPRGKAGLPRFS